MTFITLTNCGSSNGNIEVKPDTDVTMNAINMAKVDMDDLNKVKTNNVNKFIKTRMSEESEN